MLKGENKLGRSMVVPFLTAVKLFCGRKYILWVYVLKCDDLPSGTV